MPGAIRLKVLGARCNTFESARCQVLARWNWLQIICEYLLVPQSAVFNKSVPNISAIRDQQHQIQISGIIVILIILPLVDWFYLASFSSTNKPQNSWGVLVQARNTGINITGTGNSCWPLDHIFLGFTPITSSHLQVFWWTQNSPQQWGHRRTWPWSCGWYDARGSAVIIYCRSKKYTWFNAVHSRHLERPGRIQI